MERPFITVMRGGITLMEILVAIAIVAILAGIGIPSYLDHTKKAYYSEIVQSADSFKVAVAVCVELKSGALVDCDAGSNGIPPNITSGVGSVNSITVQNGVITITPTSENGLTGSETYILTPTYDSINGVSWAITGGVCGTGLISDC